MTSSAGVGLRTVAVLGAGKVGSVLAMLALDAGIQTLIAGSAGPDRISMIVDIVAPGAIPMTAADAVRGAEVVILALPLARIRSVPAEHLQHKIVVDAMNYWPYVDGAIEEFESRERSSSEIVKDLLGVDRLVKTFNHMGYHELEESARPAGAPGRKAIAVAGDDRDAVATVSRLVNALGFDPVHAGPLAAGRTLEPGTEIFGANFDRVHMVAALSRAKQPAERI
jgi:8-hydroxy-5-deazaflavin:NADPH oxidoreductase